MTAPLRLSDPEPARGSGEIAVEAIAPQICPGNIQIWDQTVGCPTCGEELWNYPGMAELGLTIEAYEARFWQRHPFRFIDECPVERPPAIPAAMECHDDGDEDAAAWQEEAPIGGWIAMADRYHFGNATERWVDVRDRGAP